MKLIQAIIRHYKLDDVREALSDVPIGGMTVTNVSGFGHQRGHTELYQGLEHIVEFLPKIKIEIVIEEQYLDDAISCIVRGGLTQRIGDGKIFVMDVPHSVRIRTGETGTYSV